MVAIVPNILGTCILELKKDGDIFSFLFFAALICAFFSILLGSVLQSRLWVGPEHVIKNTDSRKRPPTINSQLSST